jgi:hypothetical protein
MEAAKQYGMGVLLAALAASAAGVCSQIAYNQGRQAAEQELVCGSFTHKWEDYNGCEVLPDYLPVLDMAAPPYGEGAEEDDPGWDCRIQGDQVCGVIVNGQRYLMDYEQGTFGPREEAGRLDCRTDDDRVCDVWIGGDLYGIDFELMEVVAF